MTTKKTPVSLMQESLTLFSLLDGYVKRLSEEYGTHEIITLRMRLRSDKEKAWARYLRRWVDACEDGYRGDWFEPWLPQKASK